MSKLIDHVKRARCALELKMTSNNIQSTRDLCLDASIFLSNLLDEVEDLKDVSICYGDGVNSGFNLDNTYYRHYWVECVLNDCIYICDITADQFLPNKKYICDDKSKLNTQYLSDQDFQFSLCG